MTARITPPKHDRNPRCTSVTTNTGRRCHYQGRVRIGGKWFCHYHAAR